MLAIAAYRLHPAGFVTLVGCYGLLTSVCLIFTSPVLFATYGCVLVARAICRWRGVSRKGFAVWSFASVAAGALIAMAAFLPNWRETRWLDAKYPAVRIDDRLAYERRPGISPPGKPAAENDLQYDLYQRVEAAERGNGRWWESRAAALAALEATHDNFAEAFARQQGFGLERIAYNTPATPKLIEMDEPDPVPRPEPPPVSAGEAADQKIEPFEAGPLAGYHLDNLVDFANPRGFGYPLDSDWSPRGYRPATKVRGFQPHAFRAQPGPPPAGEEWQLASLELVSLLKHDPPAVYVSDHLPRMQDLSSETVPTRPLDGFESVALTRLLDGV